MDWTSSSDVDIEVLGQTLLDRRLDCVHIQVWLWTVARLRTCPDFCQIDLDLSMSEQKKEEQRHQLLVGLVRIFTNTQTIIYLNS